MNLNVLYVSKCDAGHMRNHNYTSALPVATAANTTQPRGSAGLQRRGGGEMRVYAIRGWVKECQPPTLAKGA